jgi:hypothetical protein
MEIWSAGQKAKTLHINFYSPGTDRALNLTAKNEQATGVEDVRIWTNNTYRHRLSARMQGAQDWNLLGKNSSEGFSLGDFAGSEEKAIELKLNVPAPPCRSGENLVPLFIGYGGPA